MLPQWWFILVNIQIFFSPFLNEISSPLYLLCQFFYSMLQFVALIVLFISTKTYSLMFFFFFLAEVCILQLGFWINWLVDDKSKQVVCCILFNFEFLSSLGSNLSCQLQLWPFCLVMNIFDSSLLETIS